MNVKRFLLASAAVFVLFQVTGYIIHTLILMPTYESLSSLWRPDMMSLMWLMYPSGIIYSLLFVYLYTKWYRNGGLLEGLHFGLTVALFMNVSGMVGQYVVYPIPLSLALQWFIYGTIEMTAAGIISAAIYKPREQ